MEFVAIDNPTANKSTLHVLAAVAQHEREMISDRTKAALAAAKARGKKLGGPDPRGAVQRMAEARKARADEFARNVLPLIRAVQAMGFTKNAAIAAELNARKVPTAWGKEWTQVQVGRVLMRASRGSQGTRMLLDQLKRRVRIIRRRAADPSPPDPANS